MRLFADSINYHCTLHQANRTLPTLLMLHGFMGSEKVFDPLIEKLSAFCNPLTIDLAGHGKTITPVNTEIFTADRQSAQLKSILRRMNLKPLCIYGYSMGGRLAFQLIARYPEYFEGAIIESSHCGMLDKTDREKRIKEDEKRAREIENDFDHFLKKWQELPLFEQTPDSIKNLYTRVMKNQKAELMACSLRGFGTGVMTPVCEKLQKIPFPVQLIAGKKDQKYMSRIAEIAWGNAAVSITTVENAGHRVHADNPGKWLEILNRCLN